jgi:hypothetical protein
MSDRLILIRDIERCPYVPRDPEYLAWNKKDDERLDAISNQRKEMLENAYGYLSHEDKTVREMAYFITWFFGESNDK